MFENSLFIRKIELKTQPQNPNRNAYPFNLPFLRGGLSLNVNSPVTFFVGENGMGKSTLLEAVAVNYGFNPEGGSRNFTFSTMDTHLWIHTRFWGRV